MSIRISFKRGIKQSQQAAQYFRSVVGGLVESMLDGMEEHRYHIAAVKGPSLELRIWSVNALDQEDLHALIELLMTLHAQTQDLRQDPGGRQRVRELAEGWLHKRMGGADLYVEVAITEPDSEMRSRSEFTLAIVHGRCAMISTDHCLFTWLQEDIFGLTVAGHGSYLLEMDGREDHIDPPLRQAS